MKKYKGGIARIRTTKKTTVMRTPLMTLTLENLGYFRASKNHLERRKKKVKETSHSVCGLGIYHLALTFLAIKEFTEHLTASERGWGDGSVDKAFLVQSWGLEFCILEKRFPQIKMKPHSLKVICNLPLVHKGAGKLGKQAEVGNVR